MTMGFRRYFDPNLCTTEPWSRTSSTLLHGKFLYLIAEHSPLHNSETTLGHLCHCLQLELTQDTERLDNDVANNTRHGPQALLMPRYRYCQNILQATEGNTMRLIQPILKCHTQCHFISAYSRSWHDLSSISKLASM